MSVFISSLCIGVKVSRLCGSSAYQVPIVVLLVYVCVWGATVCLRLGRRVVCVCQGLNERDWGGGGVSLSS